MLGADVSKVLRVTTINSDFPDGLVMEWANVGSNDPHLGDIVGLLANGRNVKLTLTKDDGDLVHYELVQAE